MNIYNIKEIFLFIFIISLFNGCMNKKIEVYQQGDQLLSCNQLSVKTADLIDIKYIFEEETKHNIKERFNYLLNLKKKYNCSISHREIAFTQIKKKN